MLINLSNHPSAKWSSEQKNAASQFGEIVDLPFPDVDAAGNEKYIDDLASDYVNNVKYKATNNNIFVHIMGEMTLTFAIVRQLQKIGIPCIASTTQRLVTENPDGSKSVLFQFVRFRHYNDI